jgi:prephenate dehydrogenase
VTPEADSDAGAVALVESLWAALRMRLVRMTPAEHDARVARISHLPHAVAAALVQAAARDGAMEVASSGFADTTRIACGDPEVWADIFGTNREAVLEALDDFVGRVAEFRLAIAAGDRAKITALLRASKELREGWKPGRGEGE